MGVGMADPAYYNIHYTPLPENFILDGSPALQSLSSPGVIAISATNLQGPFLTREQRKLYAPYRHRKPREILGGSIYLYDYPP